MSDLHSQHSNETISAIRVRTSREGFAHSMVHFRHFLSSSPALVPVNGFQPLLKPSEQGINDCQISVGSCFVARGSSTLPSSRVWPPDAPVTRIFQSTSRANCFLPALRTKQIPPVLTPPLSPPNPLRRENTPKNPFVFANDTHFAQYWQWVDG